MNFQFLRKNEQFAANFFLFVLEIRNSDSAEQLDTAQVMYMACKFKDQANFWKVILSLKLDLFREFSETDLLKVHCFVGINCSKFLFN